ncbi:hypothetical protein D3C78_1958370 [compost metagenome]
MGLALDVADLDENIYSHDVLGITRQVGGLVQLGLSGSPGGGQAPLAEGSFDTRRSDTVSPSSW